MSKSPPNFSLPDFYFQVFKNICQSLRNTHGNLGINAGFSLVKNAAGELETAWNPCYVPTDAAAKPCCFIHLLGCFFLSNHLNVEVELLFCAALRTSVTVAQFHGVWMTELSFCWNRREPTPSELTEHGRLLLSWSPSLSGLLSVTADLYFLNPHALCYS